LSKDFEMDEQELLDEELEEVLMKTLEEAQDAPQEFEDAPEDVFIFPILRRPYFPGMAAPIVIEPGPYYEVLKQVSKTKHKCIGLLMTKNEEADVYNIEFKDLHKVGVLARILKIIPIEGGGAQVILNMEKRMKVVNPIPSKTRLKAKVRYHDEKSKVTKELKAYAISVISTIKELLKLNPLFKEELQIFLSHSDFTEPGKLADFAVALTTATRDELQEVLETYDIEKRIYRTLELLKKELDVSKMQFDISKKIDQAITKTQREFFLREQLRTIRKELGIEKDDKSVDIEKFNERMKGLSPSEEVKTVFQEELEKLSSLEMQSAEYAVSRGYLDWITSIPWGKLDPEPHNIKNAKKILDEDHYGLKDIKERILEFIGVGKLRGGVKGSIICLVGPPGVGKTSIGRSIARALGRKFYRFSVGGMRDEAEIKGHRRTYIGAMPGKLIQALKFCKAMNPVIMLDEVDKMGSSYQGDPASALLEVLDPEQNREFLDHYLDLRVDLSDVLFIVTANVLDTIPEPLKDRMDILRLSGYIMEEKIEIAMRYLIPEHRKEMGLKVKQVVFNKEGLKRMINGYAREAGVRGLENLVKKILRKVALEVVLATANRGLKAKDRVYRINEKTMEKYIGKPTFTSDRFYHETPVGVATGLAWTAMGGATLYIETIKVDSEKTEMHLTGQAGDVMKESSQIAWSYLHSAMHKYAPGYNFFDKSRVHIHIPEGATPKDGPSAGVTMVTALISLLTGTAVFADLGMTGEITLTGKVLGIGGVKEKVIASRRSNLTTLIFPEENRSDVDELPDYIKKGIDFYFVTHYDEVFKIAFPTLA
jgi:ATP-dependent Lon protease